MVNNHKTFSKIRFIIFLVFWLFKNFLTTAANEEMK